MLLITYRITRIIRLSRKDSGTMKELKVVDKVQIVNRDLEMVPFLTVQEMNGIVERMVLTTSYLEQQQILMASIFVCCTDLYDEDSDVDLVFEDIVYSGLWDEILEQCPYLKRNIDTIWTEVRKRQSLEVNIGELCLTLAQAIKNIADNDSLMKAVSQFISMGMPHEDSK